MMGRSPRILVAGIGNIFLGDDAFGVHVARVLMQRSWPDQVRVIDLGIRGLDLAYALMDGCETAILIDATPRGGAPGTLYVIEPELPDEAGAGGPELIEAHSLDPVKVLRLVRAMGGQVAQVRVVGCEPAPLNPAQDMQMELSPAVQAAIEPAAGLVESLVARYLNQPVQTEEEHASEHSGKTIRPSG